MLHGLFSLFGGKDKGASSPPPPTTGAPSKKKRCEGEGSEVEEEKGELGQVHENNLLMAFLLADAREALAVALKELMQKLSNEIVGTDVRPLFKFSDGLLKENHRKARKALLRLRPYWRETILRLVQEVLTAVENAKALPKAEKVGTERAAAYVRFVAAAFEVGFQGDPSNLPSGEFPTGNPDDIAAWLRAQPIPIQRIVDWIPDGVKQHLGESIFQPSSSPTPKISWAGGFTSPQKSSGSKNSGSGGKESGVESGSKTFPVPSESIYGSEKSNEKGEQREDKK